jgi:sec-independent protein translocase protein TatB
MFGIGMPELLLILAVALIVIGPKKLPDLAKSLGRAMGEFKRATNDLKESIQTETGFDEVRESFKDVDKELKASWEETGDTAAVDAKTAPSEAPDADNPLVKVKQAMDALNESDPSAAETKPSSAENAEGKAQENSTS